MSVNTLNVAEPARFSSVSDVPPGYKLTEIGIIPADWYIFSLGEISSFRTGPFGSALHRSDYIEGGIPLVNPMHIVDGEIRPAASTTVTAQAARRLAAYRFRRKDIVIGRRGDMGRCAVIGEVEDGWLCGTGSLIIRCNGNVDARFIQRTLTTERVIRAMEDASVGSTMINLNQGALARLQIQCPPIIEQRAIADALSDVDELLRALEALIKKKRAIKLGVMQQLLIGKTRLPGFSGEWETKRFGEFAAIRNHKVLPSQVNQETLCVELEHIGQGDGRLLSYSKARHSTASKYRFFPGDVLFGRLRPYLRKFWHSDRHGICTTEIWPLIVDAEQASSAFLRALVETDSFIETASISYGTHMPRADWGVIKNFETRLPNVREQEAIANVLSDMDAEIDALEVRRDKTRAIKQGMMQQLLTGRIRLVKPEPAEADA